MTQLELKRLVAERAAGLVEDGMLVGLGAGSTASLWIELVGARVKRGELKIDAVASSEASAELARNVGIRVLDMASISSIDLAIDGADEIGPQLSLIKGEEVSYCAKR